MIRELFLYSRPGCGLCREMQAELAALPDPDSFICREINVEGIPELEHLYGARVPVLVAGNRELCEARLDREAVIAYITQQA